MLEHKARQLLPVYEHNTFFDLCYILPGIVGEARSGDEHAFSGSGTFEAAGERLNHGTTNGSLPAFGLDIDHIQTKAILIDNAVNPPSPEPPTVLPAPSPGPP